MFISTQQAYKKNWNLTCSSPNIMGIAVNSIEICFWSLITRILESWPILFSYKLYSSLVIQAVTGLRGGGNTVNSTRDILCLW